MEAVDIKNGDVFFVLLMQLELDDKPQVTRLTQMI